MKGGNCCNFETDGDNCTEGVYVTYSDTTGKKNTKNIKQYCGLINGLYVFFSFHAFKHMQELGLSCYNIEELISKINDDLPNSYVAESDTPNSAIFAKEISECGFGKKIINRSHKTVFGSFVLDPETTTGDCKYYIFRKIQDDIIDIFVLGNCEYQIDGQNIEYSPIYSYSDDDNENHTSTHATWVYSNLNKSSIKDQYNGQKRQETLKSKSTSAIRLQKSLMEVTTSQTKKNKKKSPVSKSVPTSPKSGPKGGPIIPKGGPKSVSTIPKSGPKGGPKSVSTIPKGVPTSPKSVSTIPKGVPTSPKSGLKGGPKSVPTSPKSVTKKNKKPYNVTIKDGYKIYKITPASISLLEDIMRNIENDKTIESAVIEFTECRFDDVYSISPKVKIITLIRCVDIPKFDDNNIYELNIIYGTANLTENLIKWKLEKLRILNISNYLSFPRSLDGLRITELVIVNTIIQNVDCWGTWPIQTLSLYYTSYTFSRKKSPKELPPIPSLTNLCLYINEPNELLDLRNIKQLTDCTIISHNKLNICFYLSSLLMKRIKISNTVLANNLMKDNEGMKLKEAEELFHDMDLKLFYGSSNFQFSKEIIYDRDRFNCECFNISNINEEHLEEVGRMISIINDHFIKVIEESSPSH